MLAKNLLSGRTSPPAIGQLRAFASARVKEIQRRHKLLERERQLQVKNADLPSVSDASRLNEAVDTTILGKLDSTAAAIFLRNNWNEYESIERQRKDTLSRLQSHFEAAQSSRESLPGELNRPFSAEQSLKVLSAVTPDPEAKVSKVDKTDRAKISADQGFFIRTDDEHLNRDVYTAGGADQLPEDDMNELPYEVHGFVDGHSVEKFDFQNPGQDATYGNRMKRLARRSQRLLEDGEEQQPTEMLSNYGKEGDISIPPLENAHCSGCGAKFHCNNSSLPGFVPVEMFEEVTLNTRLPAISQRTDYLCRRCYLYKEYKFLLNVNVCDVDYYATMGHLKLVEEALILLVVDMTDLECSIHPDLPDIIGSGKPMIVVGNKTDLLPPDAYRGYLKHYHSSLRRATKEAGFADKFNILKFSLISAKTGFGVEDLVTSIFTKWVSPRGKLRSNIYMVGCTNAGKSTLFNAFLQSDLCKVRAMDLVERVTTSIWPGTTLSLLKFPIWNPSAHKLELRRRRMLQHYKWASKEMHMMRDMYESTSDPKYITLQGRVENTFKDSYDENAEGKSPDQRISEFFGEKEETEVSNRISLNIREFTTGNWCYDTPGTVNRQQLLDLFTLEELINVIPHSMILPRTFIVYPGESLLIGGVARVDLIAAPAFNDQDTSILLTVFASDRLPVHYMPTVDVNAFVKQYGGTKMLAAPLGDAERLKRFPQLKYKKFWLKNNARDRNLDSFSDVTLSSVGWVSVTSSKAERVYLRAFTPGARGLHVREPLLRNASLLRGKRIPGTNQYECALPAIAEQSVYQRTAPKSLELISVQGEDDEGQIEPRVLSKEKISFDLA